MVRQGKKIIKKEKGFLLREVFFLISFQTGENKMTGSSYILC